MTNDITGSEFASPNIQNEPKATFGIRLVAHIFDQVMLLVVVNLPLAILTVVLEESGATWAGDVITFVSIPIWVGVYAWWIGTQGGSPLRRSIGVMILDEKTGSFIGMRRGVHWVLMSLVSGLVIFLGYFAMLWHPNKQTWHDRVAKAVAVKR